jgi:hypothetical protein
MKSKMDDASVAKTRPAFCWHGLAVVLHTGVGEACRCSKCDKRWETRDEYFADAMTLEEQYQAHLTKHTIQPEGTEL